MNGTTIEGLLTGMRGLVNQAEAGSSAFEKLGVSVRDNNGNLKDQRTLFLETATALQGVENQTERNALQFEIFGRAGIELGQVINLTGDQLEALSQKAEDYGLIISDDAIKASGDFNDELDTMKKQFTSLISSIISGDGDASEKFQKMLDNFVSKIKEWIPKFVAASIEMSVKMLTAMFEMLGELPGMLVNAIFEINWLQVGLDIGKGLINGIVKMFAAAFGYGWLWGKDTNLDVFQTSTADSLSTITDSKITEKTTKVEEQLEVVVKVESDGTEAGEKNMDAISDVIVDKINKALGDMING